MGVVGLALLFGGVLLLFYTLAGGHFPWEPAKA